MGYRTWLKVLPNGIIESSVWCLGNPPEGHTVLSTDPEFDTELRKNGGQNLWWSVDHIVRKHQVAWLASPGSVVPVGDEIKLTLMGLPEIYRAPVPIIVGDTPAQLEYPYVLHLGWTNPVRVNVRVDEDAAPEIRQKILMNVQFVERRS